jgi:mRNA interferase MazF
MKIKQFDIWTADLNPQIGAEPGKIRPVLVIQTDLLNSLHPSTIICPITTNVVKGSDILRVHLKKGVSNMQKPSDIMIDQIRAIDNKRFIQKIGELSPETRNIVTGNIKIILDLE